MPTVGASATDPELRSPLRTSGSVVASLVRTQRQEGDDDGAERDTDDQAGKEGHTVARDRTGASKSSAPMTIKARPSKTTGIERNYVATG